MKSIEDSIEGWEGKTITSVCNEFLFEVNLTIYAVHLGLGVLLTRNAVLYIFNKVLFSRCLVYEQFKGGAKLKYDFQQSQI